MTGIVNWDESLSLGQAWLDDDHKALVRLINAVAVARESFPTVFAALMDFACRHFQREEDHLAAMGFPGLDRHRGLHRDFMAELAVMQCAWRDGDVNGDVADVLWRWLRLHIETEDRRFADFAAT